MRCLALALFLFAGSCAALGDHPARPRLPTATEVASYVERTWESDGWDETFARFAERPGEAATLIRVDNVRCDYYYDSPDCTFDVVGRFAAGHNVTRTLTSSFAWRNGQLVGVFISVHERIISNGPASRRAQWADAQR